jgi:crotonobetainyl-CoA:carnitine CoA-transferase CaiB-like acyl-CoA transferase
MKMEGAVPVTRSPLLGEHNIEIYKGLLDLSDDDVQGLEKAGII